MLGCPADIFGRAELDIPICTSIEYCVRPREVGHNVAEVSPAYRVSTKVPLSTRSCTICPCPVFAAIHSILQGVISAFSPRNFYLKMRGVNQQRLCELVVVLLNKPHEQRLPYQPHLLPIMLDLAGKLFLKYRN